MKDGPFQGDLERAVLQAARIKTAKNEIKKRQFFGK
jgi:hypothetical protein